MIALPLLVATGVALAAGGRVVPQLSVFKVTHNAAGQEALAPATTIKPGEVIEYQARYSNQGTEDVRNLQGTIPIPIGLELVPDSVSPVAATASTDGKVFAAMPLKRLEKATDGTQKWVPVPFSQYRFVRWSLPSLAGGQSATVSARARIALPVISKSPASSTQATPAR